MRPGTFAALALAGLSISTYPQPQRHAYVGKKCVAAGGITILIGGGEIGTITSSNFASGAACTVIPPAGVSNGVALRCHVDGANTAHVVASTGVALGVSLSAATWCVEVRTVDPAFVE